MSMLKDKRIMTGLLMVLLATVTLAVFAPLRHQEFVSYDDQGYVYENRHVMMGLTGESLRWAFTAPVMGNYHPVTVLSHLCDVSLFGENPGAMKLVNLALHTASALLLFLALWRMTGAMGAAFTVSVLFAIHPLHVEPVAWISSRKDMLSTFFFFLMLLPWIRYTRQGGVIWYLLSALLLAMGLFSKPMLVTVPCLLLLFDYWPLQRTGNDNLPLTQKALFLRIIEKLPFFLLAATGAFSTIYAQQHDKAVASFDLYPLHIRIGNALISYAVYLYRMFWPLRLAVHYPHPGDSLNLWHVAAAAAVLAGISAISLWQWRKRPWLITGWLWYLGSLFPAIGIMQVGSQASADRYTYISLIGIFIMLAWEGKALLDRWPRLRLPARAWGGAVIAVLALLCRLQVNCWQDSETLFRHALAATQNNARMHNSLAAVLIQKEENEEAAEHLRSALEINDNYANARTNLASILLRQGKTDEAIALYRESIRRHPDHMLSYYNLGNALFKKHDTAGALECWEKALKLNPEYISAWYNRGIAFEQIGRFTDAAESYRRILALKPGHARAQQKLDAISERIESGDIPEIPSSMESAELMDKGNSAFQKGQYREAELFYRQYIKDAGNSAAAMSNLGNALLKQGRVEEAITSYETALKMNPDDPGAHNNIGTACYQMKQFDKAEMHYRQVIRFQPDNADAYNNLGSVYHALGRLDDAIASYEKALRMDPENQIAKINLERTRAKVQQSTTVNQ